MKTAVVTGGTKKDVDAMAVLALNIKDASPDLADELVIFHDGIDSKKQNLINNIMPTTFIKYHCPINRIKLMTNEVIRYFSPMIFCKYECIKLLDKFETVIWTDYDVLIRQNISELKNCKGNIGIILEKEIPFRKMFNDKIEKMDMDEYNLLGDCVTTPLFVLHSSLENYEKYYKWCYEMTNKYIKSLYLPEQCIYTMLIQKFKLSFTELEKEVYCYHPKDATERTKILHAYGQPKFWNGLNNEKWNMYYDEWMNIVKTSCIL